MTTQAPTVEFPALLTVDFARSMCLLTVSCDYEGCDWAETKTLRGTAETFFDLGKLAVRHEAEHRGVEL